MSRAEITEALRRAHIDAIAVHDALVDVANRLDAMSAPKAITDEVDGVRREVAAVATHLAKLVPARTGPHPWTPASHGPAASAARSRWQ